MTEVSRPPEYASTTFLTGSLMSLPLAAGRSTRAPCEPDHDRLLHVQPVLGLVEDDRGRPVEYVGGDLVSAMGGQAMHDHRVGIGQRHGRGVHLVAEERLAPARLLRLL